MSTTSTSSLADLPQTVQHSLSEFVQSAESALGSDLLSVVLYGSAAEGRLRATSDINLALVLSTFDPAKVDRLREPLRAGQTAMKLAVMFILKTEITKASEAFAVKFADLHRRRRILFGEDPFAHMTVPRGASITRLRQVLFNLILRLRAVYAYRGLREEQLTYAIADFAGPLRACAASILELEGQSPSSPKEALQKLVSSLSKEDWPTVLSLVSEARENRLLTPGAAAPTLLRLIDLAQSMQARVDKLG